MSARLPAALAHLGTVLARGVWFDLEGAIYREPEALQRALALWEPGCELYRCGGGLLLRWLEPRRLDARAAPGAPLVELQGLLCAMPLSAAELRGLAAPAGAAVLLRGGEVLVARLLPEEAIDPAAAIDPGPLQLVATAPLAAPPRALVVAAPEAVDLRALARAPEDKAATSALEAALEAAGQRSGERARPAAGQRLRALAARLLGKAAQAAARIDNRSVAGGEQRPPSFLARLSARLSALARRLSFASGLAQLAGRRHAQHLAELLELFDRGELDQALRRAVPMAGRGEKLPAGPPSLALPRPRKSLELSFGAPAAARGGLALGADLFDHLRALYRSAASRLASQGRHEEAAFVLADLLGDVEEAVAALESAGKLQLAARLAEARGLPPGLVVRLWFGAGEWQRAVLHARVTGSFAEAVLIAEGKNASLRRAGRPDLKLADQLRGAWAQALAGQGDFAGAVDLLWREPAARAATVPWIDAAIEQGGVTAARMLAKKLAAQPQAWPEVRARAQALCDDDAPELHEARMALARGLRDLPADPAARALLRPVVRALVRDAGSRAMARRSLEKLAAEAREPALLADLPLVRPPRAWPLAERTEPLVHQWAAADVGRTPVRDAALLPDGRLLLALGEAGAGLYSREGKLLHRFPQPAHQLVVSDHGDRALLLARRGALVRICRADLRLRTASDWTDLPLASWAATHDGSFWYAAEGASLLALDLLDERARPVWRVGALGQGIGAIARSPEQLSLVVMPRELWSYQLPKRVLRARTPLESPFPPGTQYYDPGLDAQGAAVDVPLGYPRASPEGEVGLRRLLPLPQLESAARLTGESEQDPLPAVQGKWTAVQSLTARGVTVGLFELGGLQLRARLELGGASKAVLRFCAGSLVAADDRGRVVAIELDEGQIVRNLRV